MNNPNTPSSLNASKQNDSLREKLSQQLSGISKKVRVAFKGAVATVAALGISDGLNNNEAQGQEVIQGTFMSVEDIDVQPNYAFRVSLDGNGAAIGTFENIDGSLDQDVYAYTIEPPENDPTLVYDAHLPIGQEPECEPYTALAPNAIPQDGIASNNAIIMTHLEEGQHNLLGLDIDGVGSQGEHIESPGTTAIPTGSKVTVFYGPTSGETVEEMMQNAQGDVVVGTVEDELELFNEQGMVLVGNKAQGTLLGDVNEDGTVNLLDVEPFIGRLSSGEFQAEADVNEDGTVNLLDVEPFIDELSN